MNPVPNASRAATAPNNITTRIIRNGDRSHVAVVCLCRSCVKVPVDGPREICRRCRWMEQNRDRLVRDTSQARWIVGGFALGGIAIIAAGLLVLHFYYGAI